VKCSKCGALALTGGPKCGACGAWGTLERWAVLEDVAPAAAPRVSLGVPELDALVGGGFVRGAVYRMFGPPGCGKSTIALDLALNVPAAYAAGEEPAASIRMRADRIAAGRSVGLLRLAEVGAIEDVADLPADVVLLVVDSLNYLRSRGVAGTNENLEHATRALVQLARDTGAVVLLISHVNREGAASGTTGVDHAVEAVIELGGGQLTIHKNRHGPAPATCPYAHHEGGIRYGPIEGLLARHPVSEAHPDARGDRPRQDDPDRGHAAGRRGRGRRGGRGVRVLERERGQEEEAGAEEEGDDAPAAA
jgi:hypothetical protein